MSKKPSGLFIRCWNRASLTPNQYYKEFSPNYTIDSETGKHIEDDQTNFDYMVEQWILANQQFIALYLKTKNKEELEKAQTKFNFTKDL